MGHYRQPLKLALIVAVAAALPCAGIAEVLVYKGDNKWVAPEDNKPLQALLKDARAGKTTYKISLPDEKRALAVTRLEIVAGLLAREAKTPIVMEEEGKAKSGTIEIR